MKDRIRLRKRSIKKMKKQREFTSACKTMTLGSLKLNRHGQRIKHSMIKKLISIHHCRDNSWTKPSCFISMHKKLVNLERKEILKHNKSK